MSPSCRSYIPARHVMRMVVEEPYSEPKLRVKWSGPRSITRALPRGKIALIRFSLIRCTSVNGSLRLGHTGYRRWCHQDHFPIQPSLPNYEAFYRCRVLRSLVRGIEMDLGAFLT